MGVSKVALGEKVLIDLTKDTVTPETLAEGVVAHNSAGEKIVGEMKAGGDIGKIFAPILSESGELICNVPTFEVDSEMFLWASYDETLNDERYAIDENGYLEVRIDE